MRSYVPSRAAALAADEVDDIRKVNESERRSIGDEGNEAAFERKNECAPSKPKNQSFSTMADYLQLKLQLPCTK